MNLSAALPIQPEIWIPISSSRKHSQELQTTRWAQICICAICWSLCYKLFRRRFAFCSLCGSISADRHIFKEYQKAAGEKVIGAGSRSRNSARRNAWTIRIQHAAPALCFWRKLKWRQSCEKSWRLASLSSLVLHIVGEPHTIDSESGIFGEEIPLNLAKKRTVFAKDGRSAYDRRNLLKAQRFGRNQG